MYASTGDSEADAVDGAGAAGAGRGGGAENRSHCLRASDHMWRRIACATGASSSVTLRMVPATTTPSRNGRNTLVSTVSQVLEAEMTLIIPRKATLENERR